MKLISFTIITFFIILTNTYSQTQPGFNTNSSSFEFINYQRLKNKDNLNKNYEGSPYLNEEFILGSISPNKKNFLIRYNAYNDLFEVKKGKDSILNLNKRNLDYIIELDGLTFKSFKYRTSEEESKQFGYFAIMTNLESNFVLLKNYEKKFTEEQKAINSYTSDIPASFSSTTNNYFLLTTTDNKEEIKEISTKAKDLYNLLPKKKDKIKSFIKKDKLKLKNESDLIKVINYINTLE